MTEITTGAIAGLHAQLQADAEAGGYFLNPDADFVDMLCEGLLANTARFGYQACPCRLASGERAKDLDIICPCDYRDADLEEFGACYCALYVSPAIAKGEEQTHSIPERRPVGGPLAHEEHEMERVQVKGLPFPVWRCKVCGYLCARPTPPLVCPVCKASRDRFERFM